MNYKNKYLLMLLLCLAVCLLCACSENEPGEQEDKSLIVVGFSQVGSESSWRVANSESMKEVFAERFGYELIFDDARQKQENQYKAIRKFIQQGVDYIVLAPMTEDGWDDVLLEAKNAGIPVIIVDRRVNSNEKLYTAWVGSDFFGEGKYGAKWLEEQLKDREDETVNIVHLQGTLGATAQIGRTNGLLNVAADHSNWVIDRLEGEYTEAKSYELIKSYLSSNPDKKIDVLFCENDNMAFGAMRALDEAGIKYGRGSDLLIVSFDAVKSAMEECLKGNINLLVECNPLQGPMVAKIIESLEAGESIEKNIYIEETAFTKDNITKEIIDGRQY